MDGGRTNPRDKGEAEILRITRPKPLRKSLRRNSLPKAKEVKARLINFPKKAEVAIQVEAGDLPAAENDRLLDVNSLLKYK